MVSASVKANKLASDLGDIASGLLEAAKNFGIGDNDSGEHIKSMPLGDELRLDISEAASFVPGVNMIDDLETALTGKDIGGVYKDDGEIQDARFNTIVNVGSLGIDGFLADIAEDSKVLDSALGKKGKSGETDFKSILSEIDARGYDEFISRTDGIFGSELEAQEAYQKLLNRDFEGFAEHFDFSSPYDGAVFWSKNIDAAAEYSKSIDGTIMENTQGGKVLNGWDWLNEKFPTWDEGMSTDQSQLWEAVSSRYANGTEGTVSYVHPKGQYGNVWLNTEFPIIKKQIRSGKVTSIEEVLINGQK